jgi:hypothetical protein
VQSNQMSGSLGRIVPYPPLLQKRVAVRGGCGCNPLESCAMPLGGATTVVEVHQQSDSLAWWAIVIALLALGVSALTMYLTSLRSSRIEVEPVSTTAGARAASAVVRLTLYLWNSGTQSGLLDDLRLELRDDPAGLLPPGVTARLFDRSLEGFPKSFAVGEGGQYELNAEWLSAPPPGAQGEQSPVGRTLTVRILWTDYVSRGVWRSERHRRWPFVGRKQVTRRLDLEVDAVPE